MGDKKNCLGCGQMFDVSRLAPSLKRSRSYCKRICFYQRTKRNIKEDIRCACCGNIFIAKGSMPPPNYKSRRFCNQSCAASFQWDRHRDDFEILFWSRVSKQGMDDCWPWKGNSFSRNGYGRINYKGKLLIAHRVAYRIAKKDINEGMHILHSCDNPPCCNPAHLREGTHLENMADMTKRKRRAGLHRDINPMSKVTAAEKTEIIKAYDALPRGRRAVKKGEMSKLSKKYGLSAHLINDLVRHRHI